MIKLRYSPYPPHDQRPRLLTQIGGSSTTRDLPDLSLLEITADLSAPPVYNDAGGTNTTWPATITYPDTEDWYGIRFECFKLYSGDYSFGYWYMTGTESPTLAPAILGWPESGTETIWTEPYYATMNGRDYIFGLSNPGTGYGFTGHLDFKQGPTLLQTLSAFPNPNGSTDPTIESASALLVIQTLLVSSGGPLTFRLFNTAGQGSSLVTFKVPPVAQMNLSFEEPMLYADFAGSYDVDGVIVQYEPQPPGIWQTSPEYQIDLSDFQDFIVSPTNYNLRVYVIDDDGLTDYADGAILIQPGESNVAQVFQSSGAMLTALRVASYVQTYCFKDSVASRETRGLIAGCKNPSLWIHDDMIYCAVQLGAGDYHVFRSADAMRTWEQITVTPVWDASTYSKPHGCGLANGGAAAIAFKKATNQIWFKPSTDNINWPADGSAIEVGAYGGSAKLFSIRQREVDQGFELIVTNSLDTAWSSTDDGHTWNAL